MSTPMKTASLAMAVAAAGAFTTAAVAPAVAGGGDKVKCYGVNICKGHNDCAGENHSCAGQASCKGTGFVLMSAKACADIGGKTK